MIDIPVYTSLIQIFIFVLLIAGAFLWLLALRELHLHLKELKQLSIETRSILGLVKHWAKYGGVPPHNEPDSKV